MGFESKGDGFAHGTMPYAHEHAGFDKPQEQGARRRAQPAQKFDHPLLRGNVEVDQQILAQHHVIGLGERLSRQREHVLAPELDLLAHIMRQRIAAIGQRRKMTVPKRQGCRAKRIASVAALTCTLVATSLMSSASIRTSPNAMPMSRKAMATEYGSSLIEHGMLRMRTEWPTVLARNADATHTPT